MLMLLFLKRKILWYGYFHHLLLQYCCGKSHKDRKPRACVSFSWDCRSFATHLAKLNSRIWTRGFRMLVQCKSGPRVSSSFEGHSLLAVSSLHTVHMSARQRNRLAYKFKYFCIHFIPLLKQVAGSNLTSLGKDRHSYHSAALQAHADQQIIKCDWCVIMTMTNLPPWAWPSVDTEPRSKTSSRIQNYLPSVQLSDQKLEIWKEWYLENLPKVALGKYQLMSISLIIQGNPIQ